MQRFNSKLRSNLHWQKAILQKGAKEKDLNYLISMIVNSMLQGGCSNDESGIKTIYKIYNERVREKWNNGLERLPLS